MTVFYRCTTLCCAKPTCVWTILSLVIFSFISWSFISPFCFALLLLVLSFQSWFTALLALFSLQKQKSAVAGTVDKFVCFSCIVIFCTWACIIRAYRMTAPLSDCTAVCSQRKPLLFEVSHPLWSAIWRFIKYNFCVDFLNVTELCSRVHYSS